MTEVPLIEIEGLQIIFHGDDGRATHAVDRVDLSVAKGATLGLVGESGCGKSVTSLSIMGLVPSPPGKVEADAVLFSGSNLLALSAIPAAASRCRRSPSWACCRNPPDA